MGIEKEISCYSTSLMVTFARSQGLSDTIIFRGIEKEHDVLTNHLEWTTFPVWDALAENIKQIFPDSDSPLFDIGKEISNKYISNFQLFLLKIAPKKFLLARINKHFSQINKSITVDLSVGINSDTIEFIPHDKTRYSKNLCEYNKGCAFSLCEQRCNKNVTLKELRCALHNGSDSCIYELTWDPQLPLIEKLKSWFIFRIGSQKQILSHIEAAHQRLQSQYAQIKSLQEFYSHIMSNMWESVIWCDERGLIRFTNPGFLRFTGLEQDSVLNCNLTDFIRPSNKNYNNFFQDCRKNPFKPIQIEIECRRNGLLKRIGEANIAFVASDNRDAGFLIVIRDITEAKEVEKQLYLAQSRYRSLYENSPALIVGLDVTGNIIYANPSMVRQTGYSEDELKAMSLRDLIAPGTNLDLSSILTERVDSYPRLQEVHFKTKDNQWKAVALNTYPLFDSDGQIAGLAGIGVDITETKRLNEQITKAQRMELLGQLAGGLAHDFTNILSLISGYSNLITRKSTDEKSRKMGETILNASNRAYDLIKKLVSFSKGNTEITFIRINLNEIADEVKGLVTGYATSSVNVVFDIPEEQFFIMGDSGSIHQCLLNLCTNASDALKEKNTSNGAIIVRLSRVEEKELVKIEVEDNATGIPPQMLEKIFDPFFTTKKEKGGTGMGLSVVYGIVKSHKGTITVDSRPGEGTTFIIELPLLSAQSGLDAGFSGFGSIVIIDDDPTMRGFCMEVLRYNRYNTVEFSNASSALEWLSSNADKAWFILTDICMPDMIPLLFTKQVQQIDRNLEIVWMSGYPVPDNLKDVICDEWFIKKPFTPYGFMEFIKKLESRNLQSSPEIILSGTPMEQQV
jgi:PAS domain S-box-containing protein